MGFLTGSVSQQCPIVALAQAAQGKVLGSEVVDTRRQIPVEHRRQGRVPLRKELPCRRLPETVLLPLESFFVW